MALQDLISANFLLIYIGIVYQTFQYHEEQ
ncbi:Uncharacterised protein [Escherichia coli]|mgnify:CR=1 FL=1|nr:Uncharacterised protein [Escherichia coli]